MRRVLIGCPRGVRDFNQTQHRLVYRWIFLQTSIPLKSNSIPITFCFHCIFFDYQCKQGIKSTGDFEWTKQTRTYFMEKVDKCVISITDVDFVYQNEFLGCTERLVITPLTDRCYITLAQALNMHLGGAPAGPAGTGKTETTKDMGRCLGKYVVVFNCSDQMDFRGLGRIYKGLAQSGSWGCFDEFNRIELPVLSVAAQQIAIILAAKREGKTSFIFSDGDHVELNPEFGLFLTMNPGYAGRQELPENLKINFRSVAMMVPDRQIIIRVKLAACGFVQNIILARKFYVLYKLCEEQLTKQVHYDFGLRNILSVLRTLGAARRANPSDPEERSVMRCLRDMNLSKLVDKDEPLFMSLINDLFPGIVLDKVSYPELQTAIRNQVNALNLINHPAWNLKIIQLFETQRVRHGMMTLGPSGAGKTCCINVLMRAMGECGAPHREMRMNPKAITAPEMFGRLDVATNDWTDGIFSTLWRRSLKTKKGENVWIVLDGPVDAIWIENLNSVLDDNKTLTLANGDRIPMAPNCKIVFEVHNIDNASPATVSRNGMVFMSSSVLDWDPITRAWLLGRPVADRQPLHDLFQKSFPQTYRYVIQNLNVKMDYHEAFFAHQALSLLTGLLPSDMQGNEKVLSRCYVFALMWSFGALLELDDRSKMEEFWRRELHLDLPTEYERKTDTIFEYRVDNEGLWVHWRKSIEDYIYPKDYTPEFASILVPNVDNVRTDYLIDLIAKQGKAVLLIGEPGTAKTVMINKYMGRFNPETHASKSFNFSSATTPALFQRTIESFVEKRVGTTYGPPAGKKMTVFIDDINMPKINEWGDQIANEIVRQTMEMNGFYSLEKPGEFTNIVDVQFLAAMNHPGGGRNDIPERLKRQFCTFNCTLPSDSSIDTIFSVIGLGHYCAERGFPQPVISLVAKLVPLTRVIWQHTKNRLLPTPAKFHYIFNLRDLSRIWQGMLNSTAEVICSEERLVWLWKHEMIRVIADRFTVMADGQWFDKYIGILSGEVLSPEQVEYLSEEAYFVDFLRDPPELTGEEPEDFDISAPKVYEPVESIEALHARLLHFVASMNENVRGANMDLVFFKDAMTHLVKVSRVIRSPRGNALLVGVGGSGKRSLTRLASYIADYEVFQITLTRAVVNTLLLKKLEFRMNFISGLFARDEMDEVLTALVPVMKKEFPKRPPENEILNEYFMQRVRKNLHVVLCFSPVGEKFRQRALYFPGLISGCTIDWFQRWPQDALLAVAKHFLGDYDITCSPTVKASLIGLVADVHDDVAARCSAYFERYRRTANVTPKSYISFITGYMKVYQEQVRQVNEQINRLGSGLHKLMEAHESIAKLSIELANKEKELEVANREAEAVLVNVMQQTQAAEQVKNKVLTVKDKCLAIVHSIQKERAIAEEKLEAARPALEEAEEALNTIKPGDISTVRKLAKPPHLIMRIMDCVLLLFKRKVDPVRKDTERVGCIKPSWSESLKILAGSAFLNSLLFFPRDLINEETVDLIQPYLDQEDYNLETAKKVCGNVAGLCSWTLAMEKFYWINKEVIPLKDNLAKMESKLTAAKNDLAQAESLLAEKEALLATVREQYESAMRRKQELADDADTCRRRMTTATMLIDGLSGEKVRWTEETLNLKEQVSEWNLEGLPSDDLSVQNAIIVTSASRYPLLIDPQSQGKNWIKRHEAANDLMVTTLNHKYFRTHLEDSLSQGRPLLIEDIGEELDPSLDEVLEKNFLKSGTGLKVKVGDKEVDLQKGFTLYMTTKLPNPTYPPEVSARASIIDFTVTSQGLEDQLLARVIQTEKEDLERQRLSLVASTTANRRRILELENSLLYRLANTEGSLVDDQGLVDVLQTTKSTSIEVAQQLTQAQDTEAEITAAREEFRPVAARGSLLYFLITELTGVNPMYHTGLNRFLRLFDNSMACSEPCPVTSKRVTNIINYMTRSVWAFAVRGMFKMDRTMTTLMLALRIDLQRKNIRQEEFITFIQGGSALDLKLVPPKPGKWVTDMTWLNLVALSKLNEFANIVNQVLSSERQWRQWFDKEAPEEEVIPCGYENSLDVFRRLLLVRSWCPDRTLQQAKKYIMHNLGPVFCEDVVANIEQIVAESDCRTPLVGLLSMGADPTPFIEQAARRAKLELNAVSMGQGQEIHARRLVKNAMAEGHWVLLQNCHLCLTYVDELFLLLSGETAAGGSSGSGGGGGAAAAATGAGGAGGAGGGAPAGAGAGAGAAAGGAGSGAAAGTAASGAPGAGGATGATGGTSGAEGGADGTGAGGGAGGAAAGTGGAQGGPPASAVEGGAGAVVHGGFHERFRLWVTTEEHKSFPINFLQVAVKFTNEPPEGIKANLYRTYSEVTQDFLDTCVTVHWKVMLYALAFLHCTAQERRKFGPMGWSIPYEYNQSDFSASVQFIQNHLDSLEFKKAQKVSGIDWKCVRYMIAEIQYGGRVTDDFDLRLLITITRTYFQERMFSPEYELSANYPIPRFTTPAEYLNYISQDLPQRDSPEALGLHSNAEITYSAQTTSYILSTIVSIQPKESAADSGEDSSASGGKPAVVETRESIVHRMCTDMLSKLPPAYVAYRVAEQIDALGSLKPMTIFLRQEVDRINKVIVLVGSTLTDLRLAIDGTVVMNDILKDALDCIYDARVPSVWTRSSWDSTTLGFWYTELIERNAQFSSWLENGRPICFWMTGFFNPQGFLTAMRQEVSRMHEGWSLDSVILASKMTRANAEDLKEPPSEGVYVYGLFLEGAAWDRRSSRLVEPKPKILYDSMAVLNIYAVQESQGGKRPGGGGGGGGGGAAGGGGGGGSAGATGSASSENKGDSSRQLYSCPIYRKPRRTDRTYVASVDLGCTKTPDHWIMRGVAILCDIK
ncbi:Dynein heavy chain 5 axonemal [Fasciola hepatica]|uniref:Dynein heavy chain 5 axonemal n=1 Tax=Fasciola hepatica TaxID=6192 RepID=A0A4E0RFH8_FASHE|nr:Dynein heavy chain 5 axonemal [Fasciola hepatica]